MSIIAIIYISTRISHLGVSFKSHMWFYVYLFPLVQTQLIHKYLNIWPHNNGNNKNMFVFCMLLSSWMLLRPFDLILV